MKGLHVSNQITDKHLLVYADRNMINMVIRNLLSNSIKFCHAGNQITIKAQLQNDKVIIAVADTGPGISETDQDKLFSMEHTISVGTGGEKGNRLGLILCRDMIVQNQGRIWFETAVGKGTTFFIELPVSAPNGASY